MEPSLAIFINPTWGQSIDSSGLPLPISPFFAPSGILESTNGSAASTLPSTAISGDILAIFISCAWYSDPPALPSGGSVGGSAIAPTQGQLFPLGT